MPVTLPWLLKSRPDCGCSGAVVDETVATELERYGNLSSIRRIGVLLENEGIEERQLRKLEGALKPCTRVIPWDPTRPGVGENRRRWGVVVNGKV